MDLLLRHELPPNRRESLQPRIRPWAQDVVRQDVVVPQRGHDWDSEVVERILVVVVLGLAEHLEELAHDELVLVEDLPGRARDPVVVVVPRRVARPQHEVDRVLQVVVDPSERRVDQGDGAVACRCLGPVQTCRPRASVAGVILLRRRVSLEEWVGVDVCGKSERLGRSISGTPCLLYVGSDHVGVWV